MTRTLKSYRIHPSRSLSADLAPWLLMLITIAVVVIAAARFYQRVTKPIVELNQGQTAFFFIATGSCFNDVVNNLSSTGVVKDTAAFRWLSNRKGYTQRVKAGRYRIVNGMSNNSLVNLLRSGRQEPIRITLTGARTRQELAGKLGRHLETDSASLATLFSDPVYLSRFGVTQATLFVLFIPNTYEFFWNTSGEQLFIRMQKEFNQFWTTGRRQQAEKTGLTIEEIVTLASIIEKETNKNDEKPVMAGVYLNRLKKGMPLQADPTVIFALNDYSIKRVLSSHTRIDSPYNTYMVRGLPPGPICIPSSFSIDAVLQHSSHTYLYFCAKEDLSGYHNFASTLDEHNRNARKYQAELNKRNIR